VDSCPFCRIAKGDRGAARAPVLHEDAAFFVMLDPESLGVGHCIVVPRRHVAEVHELPAEQYTALFLLARRLAPLLKAATGARAVAYVAFGSGLPHAHLHLVPHDDPAVLADPRSHMRLLSDAELSAAATRLLPFLS
jgi:histidine triad (HIT) family protein